MSKAVMRLGRPLARRYSTPAYMKPVHMNEIPVPEGCWQDHYNAQNKKYNMHLIAGVLFTVGTLAAVKSSGLIYFNMTVPEYKREE